MVPAAASCGSLLRGASCRSRRSFAEKVARDIDYRKASSLFCAGFEICLNEDLDGLLAGINFDADWRITEIYLVSASIAPSDDRMRHFWHHSRLSELLSRRFKDVVSFPKIQSDQSHGQQNPIHVGANGEPVGSQFIGVESGTPFLQKPITHLRQCGLLNS
jgi:hypothetical protein